LGVSGDDDLRECDVVVLNLPTALPLEPSLDVREIRCENGEVRVACNASPPTGIEPDAAPLPLAPTCH
jgi:hypothetical protein